MPRTLASALVAALALSIGARPLAAQEQTADTTALSPVVVTATKVVVPAAASTAATTLLTGEELRARGTVSLYDALRTVPGLVLGRVSGPGSQTSIFLRGGNSNFTKVLVDGVPMNAPGGDIDLGAFTTDDVDRIEIVRGPASALYGSDAMTGVVQIFTKRGGPSSIAVRGATRDAQYDATASLGREARVGATTRVHGSLNGGYHRGEGFLAFNNQSYNATSSALAGVDGAHGSATVSAAYGDSRYHYPTNGIGEVVDSNAYTGATRASLSASGVWRASDRLSARAQLGSARTLGNASDLPDSPGDAGPNAFFSRSHSRTLRQLGDLQLVATLPAAIAATLGGAVEGQHASSRGWSEYGGYGLNSTFDESRTNRALYASVVGGPKLLTVDVSGRHERLRDGDGVSTGRIAVASALGAATVIRASFGTAFKEPTFDQLFNTSYSIGQPKLHPERNRSRELGVETRLPGGMMALGATAFEERFTDLVQYRWVDDTTPNYYNVRAAWSRGVELEARLAPLHGFAARGSFTRQQTRITEPGTQNDVRGQQLVRRPGHTASLDASWARARLALFATVTRVGQREDYDFAAGGARAVLPAYTLLDAAAELPLLGAPASRSLSLTLRGENLGGAVYQSVKGYATPGRTVFVGLRARE